MAILLADFTPITAAPGPPPPLPPSSSGGATSRSGLSTEAVVGITVGSAVGALLVGILIGATAVWCSHGRGRRRVSVAGAEEAGYGAALLPEPAHQRAPSPPTAALARYSGSGMESGHHWAPRGGSATTEAINPLSPHWQPGARAASASIGARPYSPESPDAPEGPWYGSLPPINSPGPGPTRYQSMQ